MHSDPDHSPAPPRQATPSKALQHARVEGSGAAAQAGGTALGAGTVQVGGDLSGNVNTGTQIVNNYLATSGTRLGKDEIAAQVAGYLRWLRERTQNIELRGIELAGGAPVVLLPLATAYVPLRAKPAPRFGADHRFPPVQRRPGRQPGIEREADIALNQVLGLGHRLAIIGGPGCGKTTVLLHMAWALASSLLSGQAEPAQSRLGLEMAPGALPLPIFVPLASYARHRRHLPANAPAREKMLAHFISHHIISKQADFDLPADFFVQLLGDGRNVLLLLDGLDEVASEGERAEVRQSVEELVSGRSSLRVLVTCRTVAYRNGRTALGADFREIAVLPLEAEQHIAPMVRQAYTCIYPRDAARCKRRANDLLDGIAQLEAGRRVRLGKDAEALVSSPLMVRLLLIVHFNHRSLPEERAELFDKAINALLQVDYGREDTDIRELSTDWKLFRDMSQHLAFYMHHQGYDQGREIDEPALKAALRQEKEYEPHIDAFLTHARQRGSVLEERHGIYRFIHLALQEFLVARYLNEVVGDAGGQSAILGELNERLDDVWWREPILLLAGYKAARTAKQGRQFIYDLACAGATPDARFCAAELAGSAALAWRESTSDAREACAARIVELLDDNAVLHIARPSLRARAGDMRSQLGDPRFDAQRLYLPADASLGFVRFAADQAFCIGTRKADRKRVAKIILSDVGDYEINDTLTPTPEFHIGRYPVTVAQFRAFIEATHHELGNANALHDLNNRPVRYVSWHEATAYCAWLTGMLADSPLFANDAIAGLVREHGWQVALPSELEWEKAARGGLTNAIFSWGDARDPKRANREDIGIDDTSAVGFFPANGFGLCDMLGNVWEWTRSAYGTYPYPLHKALRENPNMGDDEFRIVRGGSWRSSLSSARCAFRSWNLPDTRSIHVGFRVVLRSAPVLKHR